MKKAVLLLVLPSVLLALTLLSACGGPASHEHADHDAEHQEPNGEQATSVDTEPASMAAIPDCPSDPPCGDDCSNLPYEPTNCMTTPYGPARADIVIGVGTESPNMLYCESGSYALCFFSGPPTATGTNPADNRPLPCEVDGDTANCTCQVYTSGAYYVDINGILNRNAYFETVQKCGATGEDCQNIGACGPNGSAEACAALEVPPVCTYVAGQNPNDDSTSLIPGADLISTFSFAMNDEYKLAANPPDCNGPYAGCMTAPCTFPEGANQPPQDGDPITCACPIWNGTFQVGEAGQACDVDAGYVWSASNSVPATTG